MSGSKSFYVKTFAAKDSKHIFDPVIGVLLKSLKTDFNSSELSAFKKALRKEEVSLDVLRLAAKIGIVDKRTMLKNQIALWSPVKALEFAMKYFDEKLYAEEIMPEFFKDEYVMKKIILAGRCKEYTKDSILGMLCGECDELVYGQKDLSSYFNEQPIANWIDVIKQYGMENVVKGFDTEFSLAINNFHKLSKSWDHLRVVSYKNKNSEQSDLIPKDNNELFEIFGGNYDLIPRNIDEKEIEDNEEAEILVTNNKLYNSYSAGRQKVVRAYLGQNIRKLNEAIKSSSSIIFSAFDSYNGTPEAKIENTIRESMAGGYYTNTDNLTTLHKQIKTAIQNSVFRTVAECVDFVVHKYIPIMKQAKKTNAFKNLNETKIGSIGMQVFAGGNRILNDSIDYEPVLDTDMLVDSESTKQEVEVKEVIVEKPVVVEKIVEKVVEKPVIVEKAIQSTPVYYNFRGGAKNEHNSAKKLIQKLVAIQTEFNEKFMIQYRKVIKFLADVKSEDVSNDNINLLTFNSIDRILIKANKTSYKISGVIEGKSFNKDYCELLEATAQKIQKSKAFGHLSQILREMIKICESTRKQIFAARNEYMVSDKERYDTMEIELSEVKIPFDIKQEEIASLHDNFGRITIVIQERGNKAIKTQTEAILTKYIKTRDEKEKMIEEYFDRPMKTYESYLTKYDRLKPLYNMRSIIQKQYKKSYLWLNKTLDVMLAKNRLEQLKSKTLTKQVIDRISKNKIQFNPLERKEEIHKLNTKLATDSTKREYFTSYFKIHNLCVRIINAYGVLDFMELLYKELEIVGKDFNWGEFKKGFMDYLVTMMVGIDVFQQGGDKQYLFRLIGVTDDKPDLVKAVDCATQVAIDLSEDAAKKVSHFRKYVIKACDIFGISESALGATLHKDDGHIDSTADNRNKSYSAGFIKSVYDMVAVTNETDSREAFGFSIRPVPGREYIPKDFNMSEFSIKALYLPVLQVFDRFMKQRAGKDDMAFGNVDRLMMGGFEDEEEKELEAGAIVDMIEPEEEDFVIIPEASKFYLVAFAIVKHYSTIFNEQRQAERQFKPSKLSPLAMVEALEVGAQYDPKINDVHFEQSIKAFNKYWSASNKSFDRAYELLITDLNASLIFDQFGDDKDTFMKTLPTQVQSIFNTIIQTVNGFENTEFVKDYIEKYLNTSVDKMIKAKPETRKGLFKKILLNQEEKTDKEFVIFCETVLTPMYMCNQYYINMLCKFLIDFAGANFNNTAIPPAIKSIISQYNYYKYDDKFTSSSFVLAHPEIIAENLCATQVFEFLKKKYIDDMTKIINVALRYPTINEEKIKSFKDQLVGSYIKTIEGLTAPDLGIQPVLDLPIKTYTDYDKFMPSYCNTYAVGAGTHYPNKFIHYCYDNTFGFNPADFKMDDYYMNDAMKESTLTRYVCMCLAEYTPNYYIPTSFLEALLETRLHGSVFRDINPIPKTSRPQVNNDQKLDLPTELTNCDKYLSLMVHISRSENAKSTCSSLTLSDNCVANLCSAIPFLINVLKQYAVVCKDFTYCLGSTSIPAKEEASELITLLKQLYNELYKTSKKIQFGETVSGFENNGYFTTFIAKEGMNANEYKNFAGKFCRLGLTPTIHNWMNRFTCQDVNYVNYNEFATYESEILNKIDDTYFSNGFKTIVIPILADLHFRTMASHINSYTHYNEAARNVMLGGAGEMKAKDNFFDIIVDDKKDAYNVDLRQTLLNAGIILEQVDGTDYANTISSVVGTDSKTIREKIAGAKVLGTDYTHDGISFKPSFANFIYNDVIRTLVKYIDKNKEQLKETIRNYIIKHNKIVLPLSMKYDDDKRYNNIITVIKDILEVTNEIGTKNDEIVKEAPEKIFDTDYASIDYNGVEDNKFRMSVINFITKLYIVTRTYEITPKKVDAEEKKIENKYINCYEAFTALICSVFPDVTISAIENIENPYLDHWSIILRAILKKINNNSAMIDETYGTTDDEHVMKPTLDNKDLKIGSNSYYVLQPIEADRNAFKYIMEMEAHVNESRDIFEDITSLMIKLTDRKLSATEKESLKEELDGLILLREEDLYYNQGVNSLEYKSFLRYGTNLHNENLLYACSNVLGKDNAVDETSKLFISDENYKLKYIKEDNSLKTICKPNDIFFFNKTDEDGDAGKNGSLGPIIRTIQLGHALGDIPLNFDVSRESEWLKKDQYAAGSIFKTWLDKNKDKHYILGETHENIKIKDKTYKLTIEYQSLIEDSLSTLYSPEYELSDETKAVFNELTSEKDKCLKIIGATDNEVKSDKFEEGNKYITQNSLILNKKLITGDTTNAYGVNVGDKKLTTAINNIEFGINFLFIPNADVNKYDKVTVKATMEKVFGKLVTTAGAEKFNSMYHHVVDIKALEFALEIYYMIKLCKLSVVAKDDRYKKYFSDDGEDYVSLPSKSESHPDVVYAKTIFDFPESPENTFDKTGITAVGLKSIYEVVIGQQSFVDFDHIITPTIIGKNATGDTLANKIQTAAERQQTSIKDGLEKYKLIKPILDKTVLALFNRANIQAILFGNILNNYEEEAKFFNFGYKQQNILESMTLKLPNNKDIKIRIPKIKTYVYENTTPIHEVITLNYNTIVRANNGFKAFERYIELTKLNSLNDNDGSKRNEEILSAARIAILQELDVLNPMLFELLHDTIMMIDNNQDFSTIIGETDPKNFLTMNIEVIKSLFPAMAQITSKLYDVSKVTKDKNATIADKRIIAMYVYLKMLTQGTKDEDKDKDLFRLQDGQRIYDSIVAPTIIPLWSHNYSEIITTDKKIGDKPGIIIPEIYRYYRSLYNIKETSCYDLDCYIHRLNESLTLKKDSEEIQTGLKTVKNTDFTAEDIKINLVNHGVSDTIVNNGYLGAGSCIFCNDGKEENKAKPIDETVLRGSNKEFVAYLKDGSTPITEKYMSNVFVKFINIINRNTTSPIISYIFKDRDLKSIFNRAIYTQVSAPMKNKKYIFSSLKGVINDKVKTAFDGFEDMVNYRLGVNTNLDHQSDDEVLVTMNYKMMGQHLTTRLNIARLYKGSKADITALKLAYDILLPTITTNAELQKQYNVNMCYDNTMKLYETDDSRFNIDDGVYEMKDCKLNLDVLDRICKFEPVNNLTVPIKDAATPIKVETDIKITKDDNLKLVPIEKSKVNETIYRIIGLLDYCTSNDMKLRKKKLMAKQIEKNSIASPTTFFEKLIKAVGKIKNIFVINKDVKTSRNQNRISKAMFGGFSLVSGKGEDIIKHIYGDQEAMILSTFLDKPMNVAEVDKQILSYFKNSMLTLTPAFDRHMFMEILYNAKLFDTAINGIHDHIDEVPALDDDNVNNVNIVKDDKIRDKFGIMKKKATTINQYAASENEAANKAFGTAGEYNGTTFEAIFGDLYKQIDLIDRYNGASYHIIGYLKNLEYYDPVADERLKYVPERESRLDQF